MKTSTYVAHAATAATGATVWLAGLHLPAGTPAWWLQAIGPAGCAGLALISLICAQHNQALADASARRRATAAITAARSDVDRDAVDWTRLKSDAAYRSAVTAALARREVTTR